MFVFQKIWRALFFCNSRFEIRPFVLLPTKQQLLNTKVVIHSCPKNCSSSLYIAHTS